MKVKLRYCLSYFFLPVLCILFLKCQNKYDSRPYNSLETGGSDIIVDSISIKKIDPLCAPDTTNGKSSFYYELHRMELDKEGSIILADNSLNCIRIINPKNDLELIFGKKGNGPGEFQYINELVYDRNVGIIAIDNILMRATIFNNNGNVKKIIKLIQFTDDIQIIQDSLLILSRYELREGFKTIQIISLNTERLKASFGPFLEPQINLISTLTKLNLLKYNIRDYSFQSLTGILYIKGNNSLVLSQQHPYSLWVIDLNNYDSAVRFNKKVPFSTFSKNTIEVKNNYLIKGVHKSGIQLHPRIIKNKIVTAIFDFENKVNFLDIYSLDGVFIKRLKIPALKDEYWTKDFVIDDLNNIMYLLIKDREKVSWIERFKIDPKVFN